MNGAVLTFLLLVQDPTLEEILRELEQMQDPTRIQERIRGVGGEMAPLVARRVVETLDRDDFTVAERSLVRGLAESGDTRVIQTFNEALASGQVSPSRRLDLAESLTGVAGVETGALLEEIAGGEGSFPDRLRALTLLRGEDPKKAAELTADVIEAAELESLKDPVVLNQVEQMARLGDANARELLQKGLDSEKLTEDTRLAVAESLARLEGVGTVDEFIRSVAGIEPRPSTNPDERTQKTENPTPKEKLGAGAPDEMPTAVKSRTVRRSKKKTRRAEQSSTLKVNLTALSLIILLGAAFVLMRRRA